MVRSLERRFIPCIADITFIPIRTYVIPKQSEESPPSLAQVARGMDATFHRITSPRAYTEYHGDADSTTGCLQHP